MGVGSDDTFGVLAPDIWEAVKPHKVLCRALCGKAFDTFIGLDVIWLVDEHIGYPPVVLTSPSPYNLPSQLTCANSVYLVCK